jgi:proteic killer suppression protein
MPIGDPSAGIDDALRSETEGVNPARTLGSGRVSKNATGGVLELAFSTQELRTLCEAEAAADRRLGASAGGALRRVLADLRAASQMAEFIELTGSCPTGDSRDQLVIDLVDGAIVVLGPNHVKTPRTTSRGIDWSQVSRVKILRIGRSDA